VLLGSVYQCEAADVDVEAVGPQHHHVLDQSYVAERDPKPGYAHIGSPSDCERNVRLLHDGLRQLPKGLAVRDMQAASDVHWNAAAVAEGDEPRGHSPDRRAPVLQVKVQVLKCTGERQVDRRESRALHRDVDRVIVGVGETERLQR